MACGKGAANQPIEDFITHSPAPVDLIVFNLVHLQPDGMW